MPTFRELQSELKKRGIKAKGKKADLQALLDQDNERLQIEAAGPKVTDKRAAPLPAAVVAVDDAEDEEKEKDKEDQILSSGKNIERASNNQEKDKDGLNFLMDPAGSEEEKDKERQ